MQANIIVKYSFIRLRKKNVISRVDEVSGILIFSYLLIKLVIF